jgi:hypothetical protein
MRRDVIEAFDLMSDEEFEIQGRKCDDLLADLNSRSNSHAGAGVAHRAVDPAEDRAMVAATRDSQWNAWAKQHIRAYDDKLQEALGPVIEEMQAEIDELRAEVEALRGLRVVRDAA